MKQTFEDYVQKTTQIRELSALHLVKISTAEKYGEMLRENFRTIGELSVYTRGMISDMILPMLEPPDEISEESLQDLSDFTEILMHAYHLETLDPDMGWYISDHLSGHAYRRLYGQLPVTHRLRLLELQLSACYNMCLKTRRIEAVSDLSERYRKMGLKIMDLFESYLDAAQLRALPDPKTRMLVIQNARYGHCMYEGERSDAKGREKDIRGLERILDLARDPQVRALVPDYDWDYHVFRTLEYLALSLDYGNIRGFSLAESRRLYDYALRLHQLWHSDPAHYSAMTPGGRVDLALLINGYYAGKFDSEAYKKQLMELFEAQKPDEEYGTDSIYAVFHTALAYLMCLDDSRGLSAADRTNLSRLYNGIMDCALRSRDTAIASYILELISLVLENFIEIPEMPFERMALTAMAALHTPSFIHSIMVGDLTRYLTARVIDRNPALFVGFEGCETPGEVLAAREKIIDFAYHAARVHDVGKIPVIDTIFIYERRLLDFEFNDIIKVHPQIGRYLLERNESTKEFGMVACGHHRWYDNTSGYPEGLDTISCAQKTLIDIVECADCMDAATDRIGRSYSTGKSLDAFIAELIDGAGTRYAPWLPEILTEEKAHRDLERMLEDGREKIYRDTYWLLKG